MSKVTPAQKIEHCGECSWVDTVKCPNSKDGVDLWNFIPANCPLEDYKESQEFRSDFMVQDGKLVARWLDKPTEEGWWLFEGIETDSLGEHKRQFCDKVWQLTSSKLECTYHFMCELKGKWHKIYVPEGER